MKILRVTRSMDLRTGGPAAWISESTRPLQASEHLISIYSLDDPSSFIELRDLNIHPLGPGLGNYGYAKQYYHFLDKTVNEFDAVIIEGIWQYPSYAAYRICQKHNIPYFVFPHGMLDPWFNKKYWLKYIKKQVYWLLAEHHVLKNAQAVFFTNEIEKDLAAKSFIPYSCNPEIISLGIETPKIKDHYTPQTFIESELKDKRFLLFIGRLHQKKGIDLLLKSWAELMRTHPDREDLVLVIAGPCADPAYRKYLDSVAGDTPNISWFDFVEGGFKWWLLKNADAMILPSHQENFGIVVAESLSVGTPVWLTKQVNTWPDVVSSKAGFADNDTLEGINYLVKNWASRSPKEMDEFSLLARSCFLEKFEIKKSAETLVNTISKYL